MPCRVTVFVALIALVTAADVTAISQGAPLAGLRAELARAIAGVEARRAVRIESECLLDSGRKVVQMYGTGVGIWQSSTQFTVDDRRLVAVLRAFERHAFLSMPETFGGRFRKPGGAQGLRETCSVTLALPGGERTVVQLEGGEQSATLKALAAEIVEQCDEPALEGTTVASIGEGLAAVADGRLAPETLSLVAHFKPRNGAGWLLEIRHARIRSQSFSAATGYGPAKRIVASGAHIRTLARSLVAAPLPPRLSLDDYLELQFGVLNQRGEVLARPFAGQFPRAAGKNAEFLKVHTELDRLHRLVIKQGKADPQP